LEVGGVKNRLVSSNNQWKQLKKKEIGTCEQKKAIGPVSDKE